MSQTRQQWHDFLHHAKGKCSAIAFANWLEPIRIKDACDESLELEVPNIYVREYLLNNFQNELSQLPLSFTIAPTEHIVAAPVIPKKRPAPPRLNLNRLYTFEHFIEGSENQFVKSCAAACAEEPGVLYNPLFIHAPAGLGKTHLLHSIAAAARAKKPNAKIECLTTESFINELVDNLRNKTVDRMKRRFRTLDILLIDDIQFLQNRLNFEEELIHTFEALLVAGGQVVVTSDIPPEELKLSERIKGRFQGGLVTALQMPGLETRSAILQHKASLRGVTIPSDVALFLAEQQVSSVRVLEGIVNRICAHTQITQKEITCALAEELTRDLIKPRPKSEAPSLSAILKATCRHFNIDLSALRGKERTAHIARARSIAMFLAREYLQAPVTQIAAAFNRSHSTLLHACEKVKKNSELQMVAGQIRAALK